MLQKEKLLTVDYISVSIISTLVRLAFFFKTTLTPIHILSLGMSQTQAGFAMTVFTLFAMLFRPFAGNLVDSLGRKLMGLIGILLFSASTIPFGCLNNLGMLYSLQALSGISFSILTVVLTTLVTDIVPEHLLAQGLGVFALTATTAQAIGPPLAVWSVDLFDLRMLFIVAGVFLAVSSVVLKFISGNTGELKDAVNNSKPLKQSGFTNIVDKIIERRALIPSVVMGSLAITCASTTVFLVPYARLEAIRSISTYFVARAVGVALSSLLAGKLAERFNNRVIVAAGIIGIVLGVGGVSFIRHPAALILIAFIYGLGFGVTSVLLNVAAVQNVPQNRRAFANSTFYLAKDLGIGSGSVIWGAVGDSFGMGMIFLSAASFSIIVLLFYIILKGRRTASHIE